MARKATPKEPAKRRGRPPKEEQAAEIEQDENNVVPFGPPEITRTLSISQALILVKARIVGITPLLQHRFTEKAEVEQATRRMMVQAKDPRETAESHAYRMPDTKQLWHPGPAISRLLREAGGGHKLRGQRRSVKYTVPAAVIVLDDTLPLCSRDGKTPLMNFEVDSRPVVIPSTKGRIMQHRPKSFHWSTEFSMQVDIEMLPIDLVHQLLMEGGLRLGIGDFRPEKGGPFGRFRVVSWVESELDKDLLEAA
jgi:hypothetical protein